MRPNEHHDRQVGRPSIQQRPLIYARDQPSTGRDQQRGRESAATVIRGHVDAIYDGQTTHSTPQTTPVAPPADTTQQPAAPVQNVAAAQPIEAQASPYDRTHSRAPQPQLDQWKQYHTAWQDYYKQYYERFYLNEVYKSKKDISSAIQGTQPAETTPDATPMPADGSISKNEALSELRDTIRTTIETKARKVRSSKHFMPIVAGVVVLLLFSFLQYNRTFFAAVNAYVTPGNINPQNIIVDPTVSVDVGPEPKLIIPKINVEAPVVYGIGPDNDSQMKAMEGGVAHFSIPGANSVPGQVGNTVVAGHSSNDVFAAGDYKFIFAQNEKLVEGDTIYMNYGGVRYTYRISSREVVMPNEVNKIVLDNGKPMLTLISCVPLGTADKRLLIFAEQVSPSPDGAQAAPQGASTNDEANLPSNDPTFLEKLFGAR